MIAKDRMFSPVRRTAIALVGILLCAVVSVIGYGQSQSGKVLVEDVIPQGNRLVPTQRIISLVKTRPGVEYQQEVVNEDVRRLYETKLFANIRVQTQKTAETKIKVFFLIAEYPSTIQEVVYQGAKHLKPDELETLTGLRKGSPLNPIAIK